MSVFKSSAQVLMLCAALHGLAQAAPYVDVLDLPAMPSALAPVSSLRDVGRAGERLVAVGPRGHIVYSDDHGAHWQQAQVPVSADLNAVSFPTPRSGWAVGNDGVILHSGDGGEHWEKQLDGRVLAEQVLAWYRAQAQAAPQDERWAAWVAEGERLVAEGADKPLLDVWFTDEQHGFAVGVFNLLLHTTDGGRSWTPWLERSDNPQGLHLTSLAQIDGALYITGEQGLLLKLDAAGQRFTRLTTPYSGTFFGITGKAGVLLAYGLRGHAYRSTDGGLNWQPVNTGLATSLTAASQDSNGQFWLSSQAGDLLQSRDGGASFILVRQASRTPVSASAFDTATDLVLVGERGVRTLALQ
ncbi:MULTISPECIES: WD40/YVTN/BNR-like repeat-containing protein [Pseudomonas]|uniref:Glycosyl hydrolase n=1 Tax=Pseudomonas guariconensis TaxID=1288410 RepID=A0AAX0VW51_9PSED|nr:MULTISPECIES: YCF48-related protein [Pseudomonas]MBF8755434.1 glycosyl hydrolase [Pseudomonas guariconensis]MDD2091183.1 YCF48-related protein [Pseudomonas guariconensis]MDM9593512.1 YCF48-related protein [Pseudomonas guariconensis]MDM9606339.1 YCF48-related protein [Pseudomonas guariconensis]MDM9611296.1 YCF48-related protein [Pseudomonas guariconensis]